MTAAAPMYIENLAFSTASRPMRRADLRLERLACSGAGSAPERSTATRSLASCWSANGSPKPPSVMRPRAPMRPSMTGALLILSSRRMAILRPMLSPVICSEIAAPWRSNSNETSGRPVC